MVVALVTDTLVAALPPKLTLAPAEKFVPDTVTCVPPAVLPDVGLTPPIVGAVVKVTIVAVAVAVPPGPVAVRVYVVVTIGLTETEPMVSCAPLTPLIETVVAFVVVQLSVADCPAAIVNGLAVKTFTVGGEAEAVRPDTVSE
jgi:hypothetical protein